MRVPLVPYPFVRFLSFLCVFVPSLPSVVQCVCSIHTKPITTLQKELKKWMAKEVDEREEREREGETGGAAPPAHQQSKRKEERENASAHRATMIFTQS